MDASGRSQGWKDKTETYGRLLKCERGVVTRKRTNFTKKRYGRARAGLVSPRAGANINRMNVFCNGAGISDDKLSKDSLIKGRRGAGSITTGAFFVSGGGASGPFASVEQAPRSVNR